MDTPGRRVCRFIQLKPGLIKLLAARQVTVIFLTSAQHTLSHTDKTTHTGGSAGGALLNPRLVQVPHHCSISGDLPEDGSGPGLL